MVNISKEKKPRTTRNNQSRKTSPPKNLVTIYRALLLTLRKNLNILGNVMLQVCVYGRKGLIDDLKVYFTGWLVRRF